MNISKLVRFNLSRPMDQRLTQEQIRAKTLWAQNKALLESILIELNPKIQELRKKESLMASIGVTSIYRADKKESKAEMIGSGGLDIYTFSGSNRAIPGDLGKENDVFYPSIVGGLDKARVEHTQAANDMAQMAA